MENGAFDELDRAIQSTRELINGLNYATYKHNRKISPNMKPEQFGVVFDNWAELEAQYQSELDNNLFDDEEGDNGAR